MSKKSKQDVANQILKNLAGFAKMGARVSINEFIPTGHFSLDFAICHGMLPENADLETLDFNPAEPGGLPTSRIIELYGEEGGGKSSLALRCVGNAQKRGHVCLWVDTEQSFTESLAEINGVNIDELLYSNLVNEDDIDQEFAAEIVFNHIISAIKNGVKLVVLDSVANLVPKQVLEGDLEKGDIGSLARVMSKACKIVGNAAAKYEACVIMINQVREKPGVMFGDPTTTPGGRALKHAASLRLEVQKGMGAKNAIMINTDDGAEIQVAQNSLVYIRKSRLAKPFRGGIKVPIYYEPYFPSPEEVAFNEAYRLKIITKRLQVYTWKEGDLKTENGKEGFIEALKPKLPLLIKQLRDKAAEDNIVLPPELLTFQIVETPIAPETGGKNVKASDNKTGKPKKSKGRTDNADATDPTGNSAAENSGLGTENSLD